jgi:arylsulfatase A-like enzyme
MKRRQFLQSVSAGYLAGALQSRAAEERQPNIVIIYADDVGYGDVSCYGAKAVETPNIDAIAGGGLRFTNAHAPAATCTPSRYALLTGQYAWRKPGTDILPGDAALIIGPEQLTVPAMLKKQGYHTGVVGKWHLGLGKAPIDWNVEIKPGPLEIGFDYAFLIPATPDRVPCVFVENHRVVNADSKDPIEVSYQSPFPGETTGRANPELLKMKPSHGHDMAIVDGVSRIGYMRGGRSALWVDEDIVDVLSSKATAFIDRNKSNPFFLYYATHDIHVPRLPNPRFRGKTGMGPRGDAIAELDWSVGQILSALQRNGLTDNTLVIFSSDNGPVVDDGYQDEAVQKLGNHRPAGQYRGGKYSNFDGGTRVPFVARWPGHIKPDSVSNALIGQVDLLSSLAALTGQSLPPAAGPDSMDVLPALLGKSEVGRKSLIEHAGVLALIDGDWKLIEGSNRPKMNRETNTELGNDPQPQLYDLARDPSEARNVANDHPDRVRSMLAELNQIRSSGRSRAN